VSFKEVYEKAIAEEKIDEATKDSFIEGLYGGLLGQLKGFIKNEYFKLKKEKIADFKAWNNVPGRYDLIPGDHEKSIENFRKAFPDKKNFAIVNDRVDLKVNFADATIVVDFSGFKLNAEYEIPLEIKVDLKKYK